MVSRLLPLLALLLLIGPHAQAREIWLPAQYPSDAVYSKLQTPEGLGYGVNSWNIVHSKDGLHWNSTKGIPAIADIYSLGLLNHSLVAIGRPDYGTSSFSPLAASISNDGGKTWSPIVRNYSQPLGFLAGTNSPMLAFHQQLFVALSTNQIIRSNNGLQWSKAVTLADPAGIAAGKDVIVAAGSDGTILRSNDGVSWQSTKLPRNVLSIAHGNGLFIAVTGIPWYVRFHYPKQHPRYLYASTDGRIWREVLQDSTNGLESISYTDGRWFAVGQTGVRTSFNGRTWTQAPILDFGGGIPSTSTSTMTFLKRTFISTLVVDPFGGAQQTVYRKVNDTHAPLIGHFNKKLLRPGVLSLEGRIRDDHYYLQPVRVRARRSEAAAWSPWLKAFVSPDPIEVHTWSATINLHGPGPYVVQIKATDAAGNTSVRTATVRP